MRADRDPMTWMDADAPMSLTGSAPPFDPHPHPSVDVDVRADQALHGLAGQAVVCGCRARHTGLGVVTSCVPLRRWIPAALSAAERSRRLDVGRSPCVSTAPRQSGPAGTPLRAVRCGTPWGCRCSAFPPGAPRAACGCVPRSRIPRPSRERARARRSCEHEQVAAFGGRERPAVGEPLGPGLEVQVRCDLNSHRVCLFVPAHRSCLRVVHRHSSAPSAPPFPLRERLVEPVGVA